MKYLILIFGLLCLAGMVRGETIGYTGTDCLISNQVENYIASDSAEIDEDGCPESLYVYGANDIASGTSDWQGLVYLLSDGSFVCSTATRAIGDITSPEWIGFEFVSPPTFTSGTVYLIGVWCEDVSGNSYACGPGGPSHNAWHHNEDTFGSAPSTHEKAATAFRKWDIYVTYTPGSCGGAAETPNALHDKGSDPPVGALHNKKTGASALHEK